MHNGTFMHFVDKRGVTWCSGRCLSGMMNTSPFKRSRVSLCRNFDFIAKCVSSWSQHKSVNAYTCSSIYIKVNVVEVHITVYASFS